MVIMSQLASFAAAVQSGQEMSQESLYPTVITGFGVTNLPCSGGSFRDNGQSLIAGGFLPEYDVTFRIRKELLTAPPEVGVTFTWQSKPYRVARVITPASNNIYIIAGENVNK